MNKRIISLLMALVMMLSLLPTPALAAEETPIRSESDLAAMAGQLCADRGHCPQRWVDTCCKL